MSCMREGSVLIFYFSGTGNSEFAAKRIAEKTGMDTVSVYAAIRDGIGADVRDEKTLVFVTPTYSWRIPRLVEDWIVNGSFADDAKAWFVMTCGSDIGSAEAHLRRLCADKGFEFMGCGELVMPENYVAMFPVPDEDEARAIVRKALPVIDGCAQLISGGKPFPSGRKHPAGGIKSGIVNDFFYKFAVKADKFRSTDACVGCGKCVESCLLHNIKLENGRPVWGKSCTHCMACICGCPAAAIEYGSVSVGKPRYHCPKL